MHKDNDSALQRGVATSRSSPLRIASVEAPGGGIIGMTLCPGKVGPGTHHPWGRSLEADLQALEDWGAACLITLMELHELIHYQVPDLGERARSRFGKQGWFHLPIVDVDIPDAAWETRWAELRSVFHRRLDAGERIAIHCLGGLGRTGLLACRLLIERGISPEEALTRVRAVRPSAVETGAQERYVRGMVGGSS